ncbi:hypothetical protein BJX65DRAFT_302620 [Aspergillus insuetus]
MPTFRVGHIITVARLMLCFIPFWQSTNGSPYNMLMACVYAVGILLGTFVTASPIAGIIVLYVSVRDARLARKEDAAAEAADTTKSAEPEGHYIDKIITDTKHATLESSGHNGPRYLFVVSARHGRSYEAVRARSGIDDGRSINCIRRAPINEFPLPSKFTRHFAVCLLPRDVYETPGLAWTGAFRSATFWELIGPGVRLGEGEGVRWTDENIASIDGILYVGLTEASDAEISTEFYRPLKNAWQTYDPVWWNSFDFAIRLAYLLIHEETSTKNLQYMLHLFAPARSNRVSLWPAIVLLVLSGIAFFASMALSLFFEPRPEALYSLWMGAACFLVVIGFFFAAFWMSRRAEDREGPVLRRRTEELVERFEVLAALTRGVKLVRRGWK